jgi:hypothetical protein
MEDCRTVVRTRKRDRGWGFRAFAVIDEEVVNLCRQEGASQEGFCLPLGEL